MLSRHRVLALAAVLALVVASVLTGGAAARMHGGATAAGTATFSDPAGDANGAPDITNVVVSDDIATGMIQIQVTANGLFSMDPAKMPEVDVYLNVDKNPATGSRTGSEYMVGAGMDPNGAGWWAARWNGSSWSQLAATATMSASRSGDTMRFLLHKNDVGNTTGFMFYVGAATFDANGNPTSSDVAPDGDAYWTYDLSVHPMIGVPTAMPAKAVAGKKLTVTFPVTRADNGQPLTTTATIAADVTVAGKAVAHTESLANGLGKVTLTVPKTAKGKTLAVKVTITVGDQTATRVATFKVVKK